MNVHMFKRDANVVFCTPTYAIGLFNRMSWAMGMGMNMNITAGTRVFQLFNTLVVEALQRIAEVRPFHGKAHKKCHYTDLHRQRIVLEQIWKNLALKTQYIRLPCGPRKDERVGSRSDGKRKSRPGMYGPLLYQELQVSSLWLTRPLAKFMFSSGEIPLSKGTLLKISPWKILVVDKSFSILFW